MQKHLPLDPIEQRGLQRELRENDMIFGINKLYTIIEVFFFSFFEKKQHIPDRMVTISNFNTSLLANLKFQYCHTRTQCTYTHTNTTFPSKSDIAKRYFYRQVNQMNFEYCRYFFTYHTHTYTKQTSSIHKQASVYVAVVFVSFWKIVEMTYNYVHCLRTFMALFLFLRFCCCIAIKSRVVLYFLRFNLCYTFFSLQNRVFFALSLIESVSFYSRKNYAHKLICRK